jgi:hypothetical protein
MDHRPRELTASFSTSSALGQDRTYLRVMRLILQYCTPDTDHSTRFDLLYYFEVLNEEKSGWFYPDPLTRAPYFVVTTLDR